MPHKAFLKKKSLLDRFKDSHKTTGYIQSARAEHTWNNPLTRRKRTKELNRWIKSFAGKNHIHKLARFNAMQAGKNESAEYNVDCLRYGSTLELPNGVCVKVKETIRCPRIAAFIFRVLAIVERADGFVIHGFYPVYGLERRPSEEFDLHSDDATELVLSIENNKFNSRGESMQHKLTIKLHETKFDPSQYDFFQVSYTIDGNDRTKKTNGIVDASGTLDIAQRHGATDLKLVGVKDGKETDIPLKAVGISKHKDEAMSLKGFLENLTEKLTKQFDLDADNVKFYLDAHTQEMQELLDDKEMSLKEKVLFVRGEITGEKDEGYGGTKSVMSIWGNRPRDVYPEVSYSSVNDMYNTLLKYGYGDMHPIYYKDNSPEQIKGHILGYFKWAPTNSDADIEADALAAATMIKNNFNKSESKGPADEKLDYEKGHKNSKGEDAPWVIRSHEDNRILASFAKKRDAEEHLQRMKQYSKKENRTHEDLETYACFIDFENEADAKKGMEIVKGWHPVRDDTAVVVDGLGEDAANRLWDDWKRKCAKAGLAISDEGEVYKEEPACFYGNESKKSESAEIKDKQYYLDMFDKAYKECVQLDIDDGGDGQNWANYFATGDGDPTTFSQKEADEIVGYYMEFHPNWEGETDRPYKDWMENINNTPKTALDKEITRILKALYAPNESKKSESKNLLGYTSDVVSELDGIWACGEDGAKRLADKYSDTIQQNYADGDLLASETAKFIAEQENLTESRKKTESKQSEVHLELIDTIIVPKWLWEAHTFGNDYGEDLDEHEQNILSEFQEKYADCHLDDEDEESYFSSYNDFDSYGGQCFTVKVYKEN